MEKLSEEALFRTEQSDKLIDFLKRSGALEFFRSLAEDPEKSRDIPFEEFMDFVGRINGIARDIPIKDREADGEKVVLSSPLIGDTLVPKHDDKRTLLEEAYDARLELPNREDIRYMIPVVINAVHLFVDGNGRTSRVMNTLLSQHASVEDLEAALDLSPAYVSPYTEREVAEKHGLKYTDEEYPTPLLPEGLTRAFTPDTPESIKAKEFFTKRKIDFEFSFVAAYSYLKSKNLLKSVYIRREELPQFDLEDDYCALSSKKMESVLSDEDWQNILDEYYKLKKEQVEVLIDCFVHPEDHKTNAGVTLRDYFIQKAISEMESYK
jgi:hypothetical protein